jgi:transposase-like protein
MIRIVCTRRTSGSSKQWYALYRAVKSTAATLDFLRSPTRDVGAAERLFLQVLQASHTLASRVITIDKHAAYPPAFESLQQERHGHLWTRP